MEPHTQFVIQEHTTPAGVHWDLMLLRAGTLRTWRLDCAPAEIGVRAIAAARIADHPVRFLTYEGPVQNGTGKVRIVDAGPLQWDDLQADCLEITAGGAGFAGPYRLRQECGDHWRLQRR